MLPYDNYRGILNIANQLISIRETIDVATIERAANIAIGAVSDISQYELPEKLLERVIADLTGRYLNPIPLPKPLTENESDEDWNGQISQLPENGFWQRYREYLIRHVKLPDAAIGSIDRQTTAVLQQLNSPRRSGAWSRRGMVVGHVQSGKTSNYTGLICKAADLGFRLIIVLAGTHDSLRVQTQQRLDEGFLGYSTQQSWSAEKVNSHIGCGTVPGFPLLIAHSLTSAVEKGDFSLQHAKKSSVVVGGADPVLLVVKKNVSILRNLIQWATLIRRQEDMQLGRKVVSNVPILVIDDEADHASLNIANSSEGKEASAINAKIRELLYAFEKSVYIGYTATPYANIFINADASSSKFGDDLFPRDFILNLPEPEGYFGPAQLFGLRNFDQGETEQTALPLLRMVDDYQDWVPDSHTPDHEPGELPTSLLNALYSFVLVCAVREARNQKNVHNSMLVHVTRFVKVQGRVARQIEDELSNIQRRIRYGEQDRSDNLRTHLQALWADFVRTTEQMSRYDESNLVAWDEIIKCLPDTVKRIRVMTVNGSARDALAYMNHPEGINYIVIGGDKLSRGLTLEGLSVSYYLRSARLYDTLMQMGRWFGYRRGYLDLCRIFTTAELINWYEGITDANEELRRDLEHMSIMGQSPRDYGLRIRTHPAGLNITAPSKLRSSKNLDLSYAATLNETVVFDTDSETVSHNYELTERLLHRLIRDHNSDSHGSIQLWKLVPGELIADFLSDFTTHKRIRRADSRLLAKYIQTCLGENELTEWTVALAQGSMETTVDLAGLSLRGIKRSVNSRVKPVPGVYSIGRVVSPTDEAVDLTPVERARALQDLARLQAGKQSSPSERTQVLPGSIVRNVRSPDRGLLLLYPIIPDYAQSDSLPLIGLAVSFPLNRTVKPISYVVTLDYFRNEIEQSDDLPETE